MFSDVLCISRVIKLIFINERICKKSHSIVFRYILFHFSKLLKIKHLKMWCGRNGLNWSCKFIADDFLLFFHFPPFKISINTSLTKWKNILKHVTVLKGLLWLYQILIAEGRARTEHHSSYHKDCHNLNLRCLSIHISKFIMPDKRQPRQEAMASTFLRTIQ